MTQPASNKPEGGAVATTDQGKQSVAKVTPSAISMGDRGIRLTTLEEAYRFAQYVVDSGLAPKAIMESRNPAAAALIAMQAGAELGFSPMRALSEITVINGRAGLMGTAALAKIRTSGVCAQLPRVWNEGEGDARCGVIRFQRHDDSEPVEVRFTIADAKRAKLTNKSGPWQEYTDDQLIWRAVARAGKRYFSDVLLGLAVVEEVRDIPPTADENAAATARDVTPPAQPDPLLADARSTAAPEPERSRIVEPQRLADSELRNSKPEQSPPREPEVVRDTREDREDLRQAATREREPGEDDDIFEERGE